MTRTDGMPIDQFTAIRDALGEPESNLVTHAKTELTRVGLYDETSDYSGDLGRAVETLIRVFAAQRHSGYSAHSTIELFRRLASFETL